MARRSGMPLGTLSRYQSGREMKASALIALAQATGVSLEWLATGRGPMRAGDAATEGTTPAADAPISPAETASLPPGYLLLPRLEARAAAGPGPGLASDHVVDYLAFSEAYLSASLRRRPAALALIEASGDSMEPTIRDGELLLVDTDMREPQPGRIYVLALDETLLVKRLQVRMDRSILVLSDNPAYEAEVIRPETNQPLRILGQVVWQAGPPRPRPA